MNSKTIIDGNGAAFTSGENRLVPGTGPHPPQPAGNRRFANSGRGLVCQNRRGREIPGARALHRSGLVARAFLFSVLWALCFAGARCEATSQTNATHSTVPSNRYLFIVETSRSMRARGEGSLDAIQDLLNSGMGGQLQAGDTLGLWTFNKELFRGLFPLQTWSTQNQRGITGRVLNFLKSQRFEEKANMDQVLPKMQELVKRSQFITVVIISSGEQNLHGTPFDDPINKLYKTWRSQQEKAHMPFVTVLQAQNGNITEYRVGQAPWSPDLPPPPKELELAREKAKAAAVAVVKRTPPTQPTLPPLIVSGRKPQTVPPAVLATTATPSNLSTITDHAPANAIPESPTAVTPASAAPVAPPSPPASPVIAVAVPESPAAPVATPSLEGKANDLQTKLERQALAAAPPGAHSPEPPINKHPGGEQGTATTAGTPPITSKTVDPAATPTRTVDQAHPAASPARAAGEPTITPQGTFFSSKLIWVAAAGLLGLVAGLAWFLRSRGRVVEPVSLITHSLEQHK